MKHSRCPPPPARRGRRHPDGVRGVRRQQPVGAVPTPTRLTRREDCDEDGWGCDGVGMEPGWDRCGVGMGSLWPRMAPAGLPRTRQPSRPLGRHGGPQRLRGVLGEEPGATWVRGRLHGDANTRLLGGCSPRASPGCSPWGRGQRVVGFRFGDVARAIPLKPLGVPDPWSGSRVRRAGGARSGLWGCRGDECHSGAGAEPPGFR